jgi:competence ComEA-like helix-hairpin-helix protein
MKQSLATGKFPTLLVVTSLGFIFCSTACGRLPRTYSADPTRVDTATSPPKPGSINLNTASALDLERLPGIGPTLAKRIITYREVNGRFRRAEHLMMVHGISDRKFRELRSLVKVE